MKREFEVKMQISNVNSQSEKELREKFTEFLQDNGWRIDYLYVFLNAIEVKNQRKTYPQ